MGARLLVVTFEPGEEGRAAVATELGGDAEVVYLPALDEPVRREALKTATVLLARNTGTELRPGEAALVGGARLVQFVTAGVDFIPLQDLPAGVLTAANGGAYAEPMAEHALATALAAAKRLLPEHAALARGEFNQFVPNRMLAGGVCGILGFGGIGVATARLMRCLGMRIHAIRRSGRSEEPVDWIGAPDRLDELLAAADVLVVSIPLTRATRGMIGARELGLMKPDAILVNLARGEIIDEAALYAHLVAAPGFTACLDAWWVEPVRHGRFRMDHPFMRLPNVIGSPHNSASVRGWREVALRRAVANCRRALRGEEPLHLVGDDERAVAT
jgi:phosphoglycerate dehydrogenase-like enzyme